MHRRIKIDENSNLKIINYINGLNTITGRITST